MPAQAGAGRGKCEGMRRGFDWNDLRFFAVAQVGTTGAARRIRDRSRYPSAAVSSALEAAIGAAVRAYAAGLSHHAFRRTADPARRGGGRGDRRDRGVGRPEAGISGTPGSTRLEGFGNLFLAPRIGRFAERHPRLRLELVMIQQIVREAVAARVGDVAIGLAPPKESRFVTTRLTDHRLGLSRHRPISPAIRRSPRGAISRARLVGYVDDLCPHARARSSRRGAAGLKARIQSSPLVTQRTITERHDYACCRCS